MDTPAGWRDDGDCYDTHAKAIVFGDARVPEGAVLCHGWPVLRRPPYNRYGHCWLEYEVEIPIDAEGNTASITYVRDFANGLDVNMPARLYYTYGQIHEDRIARYDSEEARIMLLTHEHWGPWVEYDELDPMGDNQE